MNLLNKLTIKNLKLNKKRTVVTIIGIILSVALITAVSSLYVSSIASLIHFEVKEKGNFHVVYYNVPKEKINTFKNNRKIEDIFLTSHLGYAILKDSKNVNKPYAHMMSFTKSSLQNLSINLLEGKFPEKEDEIIIPSHLRTNGRVNLQVGDIITLDVGTRVSDGVELYQSNPYGEDEEVINTISKTYKIVGIMERPDTNIEEYSAPGYTFITYMNDIIHTENADVYARYTKDGLKNSYKLTASILGVDTHLFEKINKMKNVTEQDYKNYIKQMEKAKYQINVNSYLIALETNPLDNNTTGELGIVVLIVCFIIIVTSVFCIKNSFDISITEKIRAFGMLRSIGATKKQINKNVFYEAFILGLIGIPIGILSGFLASFILVLISNYFMKDMFTENLRLIFKFSWMAALFSLLLGMITIYLSAIRSARRASKINPIDSIRNSADIKIKSKKVRSPKIIHKIFGIGGDISYKNLKRNKRKYRTTVISIIVSVATFIALSSFMNLAFLSVELDVKRQEYNLSLSIHTSDDEVVYNKIMETTKLEHITEYTILRNKGFNITNPKYSKEYLDAFNISEDAKEGYININVVGENAYKKYIKKLGLQYDDVKDKAILVDQNRIGIYDEKKEKQVYKKVNEFTYQKGDKITGSNNEEKREVELEIGYVTDQKPFGLKHQENTMIILSDEMFNSLFSSVIGTSVYYKSDNANKLQDSIEEIFKGYDYYSINNSDENVKAMENFFTLIAIFLYGFIIVISLIGITNIFNTITTNMELRKREFATLKSVGMTKDEFKRMIRLESIFMGMKSLCFGIPIGLILSYIIYHYLAEEGGVSYPVPLKAIVISICVVFLLITIIMKYSMNKISKQNTIETIRNENI